MKNGMTRSVVESASIVLLFRYKMCVRYMAPQHKSKVWWVKGWLQNNGTGSDVVSRLKVLKKGRNRVKIWGKGRDGIEVVGRGS